MNIDEIIIIIKYILDESTNDKYLTCHITNRNICCTIQKIGLYGFIILDFSGSHNLLYAISMLNKNESKSIYFY